MQYVKTVKDSNFKVSNLPDLVFDKGSNRATFKLGDGATVRIKVVYDARMAGGFLSRIITKDGYTAVIAGNILEEGHKLGIVAVPL